MRRRRQAEGQGTEGDQQDVAALSPLEVQTGIAPSERRPDPAVQVGNLRRRVRRRAEEAHEG
jgi:hypothetical protein